MPTQQCIVCRADKPVRDFVSYAGKRHVQCRLCETTTAQQCIICLEVKPLDGFPAAKRKTSGKSSWCYGCHANAANANHAAHRNEINERRKLRYKTDEVYREKVKAAVRKAGSTPEGKAKAKVYNTSYLRKIRQKQKRDTPEHRLKVRPYNVAYTKARRAVDPLFRLKGNARSAVSFGVRFGFLTRPATCQHPGKYAPVCGGRIEAHHYMGYEREHWLSVEWLCETCHTAADRTKPPDPTQE